MCQTQYFPTCPWSRVEFCGGFAILVDLPFQVIVESRYIFADLERVTPKHAHSTGVFFFTWRYIRTTFHLFMFAQVGSSPDPNLLHRYQRQRRGRRRRAPHRLDSEADRRPPRNPLMALPALYGHLVRLPRHQLKRTDDLQHGGVTGHIRTPTGMTHAVGTG